MSRHSKRVKLITPYTHQDYTVCWICALPRELTAATVMLDERHEDLPRPPNSKDSNSYTLGSINNGSGKHNIVIACLPKGRTGNISAASVVISTINTFPNIKIGLLIGTGSGVPQKGRIRLGDVVVSVPTEGASVPIPGVVQWGLDESNSCVKQIGALNNPPDLLLAALSKMESENELNGGSKIPEYIEQLKVNYPRITENFARSETLEDILFKMTYPHVFGSRGLGHSGGGRQCEGKEEEGETEEEEEEEGENVAYGAFRDKLNRELGGTILCIETEAAGLMNGFPCIVVRGISDCGDFHRNDMWQGPAAAAAAGFAKELVTYVHSSDLEQEPSLKQLMQIEEDISKIKADVTKVRSGMTKERDTKILKWLGRHYGPEQSDFIKERQAGTGEWLLKSTGFLEWLGIPGAGKTIMTATVIDYLQALFRSDTGICISYVYCSYHIKNEQTVENLLSSLLTQLTQYQSSMPDVIETLYADRHRHGLTPTLSQISEALKSVASLYSRVFILVDALDECTCYRALLRLIFDLQLNTNSSIRVFATSRPIQDITVFFERPDTFNIKIHANEDDVRKYVRNNLYLQDLISTPIERPVLDEMRLPLDLEPGFDRSSDLCTQVEDQIVRASNGMLLLVKLSFNYLSSATSLREIQDILEESQKFHIANEDEDQTIVYKEAYHKTMEAIMSQGELSRRRATKAISWVLFARRALKISELQHAIAIDGQTVDFDDTNVSPKTIIMNICKSLLTINERDEVHLIHYTAQVYFEKTKHVCFPQAGKEIARACIRYLTYPTNIIKTADPVSVLDRSEFRDIVKRWYVLFPYVTDFWGDHARESFFERDQQEGILALLAHKKLPQIMQHCSDLFIVKDLSKSQEFRSQALGLHIAARFGLENIATRLLRHNPNLVEARDHLDRTPFIKAVEYGHKSVVKILLDNGADNTMGPLLSLAVRNGHMQVVELLINEGANIDFSRKLSVNNETPLTWAADNNRYDMVRLLIRAGANIEIRDNYGRTPLLRAVYYKGHTIVDILINSGADLRARDCRLDTALITAVRSMSEAMVQRVLSTGCANLEDMNLCGDTALSLAVTLNNEAVVRLLLKSGAFVDTGCLSKDDEIRSHLAGINLGIGKVHTKHPTPLMIALGFLVTNGADIEVTTKEGLTPLMAACGGGNAEIVEFLLDQGANTEVADINGCTPFDYAWCSVVAHPDPRSKTYNGMNFCKIRDSLLKKGARGEVNYERCKEMEARILTHKDL
ncbi:hypothetical protein H072_8034 [Dactylellina haptotyla CBS 200.50]|uniref:Uncharacterized protein n=1 Tax=Dactylellina haptotyla (strain CBS 200.50) TaxID=1284197 RepID=S8A5J0_DACHA|nr:hypothetical protein H072_8034 [Dactylellina haptotyla CBS 200.50]